MSQSATIYDAYKAHTEANNVKPEILRHQAVPVTPLRERPEIQVAVDHYAPPQYRYVATFGDYDLDCDYGQGRTPLDAIVDLLDQVED